MDYEMAGAFLVFCVVGWNNRKDGELNKTQIKLFNI